MVTGKEKIFEYLAEKIGAVKPGHPARIAIDGVDAAGKTTLANDLARFLEARGINVIRASIDGFHNSRAIRYRQGRMSAQGYYYDSFDNRALVDNLLAPLGPGGDRHYKTAVFDYRIDSAVPGVSGVAAEESVLIMEGVFLLRPELKEFWDLKIFIAADFSNTVPRAITRDAEYLGGGQGVEDVYAKRYIPGQKIYFKEAKPQNGADVVIDNNDYSNPRIVRG